MEGVPWLEVERKRLAFEHLPGYHRRLTISTKGAIPVVSLAALWLPILLSAVLVFVVSSIIHMATPLHKGDYSKLPREDEAMEALRNLSISPGNYAIPRPGSMAEMKTEETRAKYEAGPVGFLHVLPSGPPAMGKSLVQWFLYSLVIAFFVAYITSRTLSVGEEYLQIFRVSGACAFMAFGLGQIHEGIWFGRNWPAVFRHVFGGLVYALTVAGCFAGFWPEI